jgi:hypothetical protein
MSRLAFVAIISLFATACGQKTDTAAPPSAEVLAAAAPAAPSPAAAAGPDFAEAVGRFDPTTNHFIWVLPQGIHGEAPWTMNVTVKHKGEVKFESTIPLKPEIVSPGTYAEFPADAEAIRLNDAGEWKAKMAEVGKVVDDLIAKHGRGDGEVIMMTEVNTALDDAGMKQYCAEKRNPDIRAYLEEGSPAKLTAIDMTPMKSFIQGEVRENCPA